MMRPYRFVSIVSLVTSALLSFSSPPLPAEDEDTASSQQIESWISDLGARRFIVREEATLQLVEVGPAMIPQLIDAIGNQNVEGTARSIFILQRLASNNDLSIEAQSRAALEKLGQQDGSALGRKATRALVVLDERREEKSILALRTLGATIGSEYVVIGTEARPMMTARIDDQWTGTLEDLQRLKWVRVIEHLALEGAMVTDEWMPHVKRMEGLLSLELKRTRVTSQGTAQLKDHPSLMSLDVKYCPLDDQLISQLANIGSLRFLKLYGTQVTVRAAMEFQQKHMAVEVDHRLGAFLGVACPRAPEPCFIRSVQSDTAAARAGIQAGDLIIEFDDEIVRTFDDLKRLISRHKSGEKTTIVMIRPGLRQSLTIKKTGQLTLDLQLKKHALGLEITGLEMKSPWYLAGLRQGDVINIFHNQSVMETKMMEDEFKMAEENELLSIILYRKPDKKKANVVFGEWK